MMSEKPLIGLTTYGRMNDGKYSLPAEYILSVRQAGGIPLMLPPGETETEQLTGSLDGIVFCSGLLRSLIFISPKKYSTREI